MGVQIFGGVALFRVLPLPVLMDIWFITSLLEANELIKFLNGVEFYFRFAVMGVSNFLKVAMLGAKCSKCL